MITRKPPKQEGDTLVLEVEIDADDFGKVMDFEVAGEKTKVVIRVRRRRLVFSA